MGVQFNNTWFLKCNVSVCKAPSSNNWKESGRFIPIIGLVAIWDHVRLQAVFLSPAKHILGAVLQIQNLEYRYHSSLSYQTYQTKIQNRDLTVVTSIEKVISCRTHSRTGGLPLENTIRVASERCSFMSSVAFFSSSCAMRHIHWSMSSRVNLKNDRIT